MRILDSAIGIEDLKTIARDAFGDLVKAVVDIEKQLIAIDAELHSDLEALLLDTGSKQKVLWGINFYPDMESDDFIEFDSMINVRPSQGNKTRGIDDEGIQRKIIEVVAQWIKR